MKTYVLSLGGSLIVPDAIDWEFINSFRTAVEKFLKSNPDKRLILIAGGGRTARNYQGALKKLSPSISDSNLDELGIAATYLNATLINKAFASSNEVVTNPTEDNIKFEGQILVACGYKPGYSTDMDSAMLAKKFASKLCINLSNIDRVYTKDPRKFSDAKPIDKIKWTEFIGGVISPEWKPGENYPFDPVASAFCRDNGISVICANGKNIENTINILSDKSFVGTLIEN